MDGGEGETEGCRGGGGSGGTIEEGCYLNLWEYKCDEDKKGFEALAVHSIDESREL